MYFGLSEEQKSLEENIKRYLAENAPLDKIKAVANGDDGEADSVHKGIIELGLSGLLVPEQYGGLELNMLFATVVSAALGSGTAPVPYVGSYVMAPLALNLAGSEEQKNKWLPKIAAGECQFGVGLSEYVGAREDAGFEFSNGKINGRSLFLIDGKNADGFILSDKSGGLYVIDSKTSGIEIVELTTVDKTRTSIEILLKNVNAELLEGSKDKSVIEKVLDAGRLMLAADTVGAAQVMLDKSVAYSLERKQFGRLIGSFQAVKHMLADVAVAIEFAKPAVYRAAYSLFESNPKSALHCAHAKYMCSQAAELACKNSIQAHGAMGYTWEMDLHIYMRKAWSMMACWGNEDRQQDIIFKTLSSSTEELGVMYTF